METALYLNASSQCIMCIVHESWAYCRQGAPCVCWGRLTVFGKSYDRGLDFLWGKNFRECARG
jgi:hypothetical protein